MERVAVTTSEDRYAGMASELVAVGLQPVRVPCVSVRVAESDVLFRTRAACEEADLIVLLASRPLQLLWGDSRLPDTPFAVVSPALAAHVASRGGRVAVVGEGNGLDFAELLAEHITEKRVVMAHGATTDPRVVVALKDSCADMHSFPIYCSMPQPPDHGDELDAAVFLSPVAVEGWVQGRGLGDMTVACLGSATEGALRRYDRDPEVISRSRTYSELANSLAGWMRN